MLIDRAKQMISLDHFQRSLCLPILVKENVSIEVPNERVYILRMLIRKGHDDFKIPCELRWLRDFIELANEFQKNVVKISHSFVYLTVRHGLVTSQTDDEWHTDGFSMKINHLPEQNYIWCDHTPTKIAVGPWYIPEDFDPLVHNLHHLLQDQINYCGEVEEYETRPGSVYCLDPYVVHKRPSLSPMTRRTFIRISFCPIEIEDKNNTPSLFYPNNHSSRDGVVIRDTLTRYIL